MQGSLRDELEKLGIYQLRMYAREVGVKLATTLKKADLIDAVLSVLNGEKEPYVKKTKKGRPPKDLVQISSSITSNFGDYYTGLNNYEYGFQGLASKNFFVEKNDDAKLFTSNGLLDIFPNGSGLVVPLNGSGKYGYISAEMIEKFQLKKGDFLEVNAYEVGEGLPYVVDSISFINYLPFDAQDNRNDTNAFVDRSEIMEVDTTGNELLRTFDVSNIKIFKGDRILVSGQDRRILPLASFNIASVLTTVKDLKTIVITMNTNSDYLRAYTSLNNVTCIGAGFGEEAEMQLKMFEMGMNHVKNLAKYKGSNILCIIPDLDDLVNICDEDELDKWVSLVKRFYLSAGTTENGSLTILLGAKSDSDIMKQFETNENVYLRTCSVEEARQLMLKFNWLSSGRNEIDSLMCNNDYGYILSSYLRHGDYVDNQKQLEDWVSLGCSKDEIKSKMKEITRKGEKL